MNKKLRSALALLMGVITATSFAACGKKGGNEVVDQGYVRPAPQAGKYTYYTYTAVSPSNWNGLTYQDNNDTQILNYLTSPLFEFDFKFDDAGEIIPGEFEVEYSFATSLRDVSVNYGHDAGSAMAWEIKIRDDGKWDDGTPIVAGDFVYTAKEQLNPLFMNHRADNLYNNATVVKNAEAYVKQGSSEFRGAHSKYRTWEEAKTDSTVKFDVLTDNTYVNAYLKSNYASYKKEKTGWAWTVAALADINKADDSGRDEDAVFALQGKTWAEIEADATLKATWDKIIGWWQTDPNEELHFFGYDYTWPTMAWDQVGFYAPDDTTIVLELTQPLQLLKEDGTLSYKAAYNMASLDLVKKDLYEANKVAPVEGSTLWTSKYHSSLDTTASWGPYKLTSFQAGKWYTLEKNPNWYGWNMEKYDGQYQTDMIVCETIAEYNTAFMKFLKGDLNGIGIDVSVANDYKNSERAYFTPDDFVGSLQLQSSADGLKGRESAGVNKTILLQPEFRKALSLGLDRNKYAKATTTSSLAGFGLFNSMHYYDVANGKVYRESDEAKKVLCDVYGVNVEDFANLDAAVDSITGYDLVQARDLVDSAVAKAIAAGDLKADANGNVTDKVVLTYGTSVDNDATRRNFDQLTAQWTELMKDTKLEGKFELEFNASFGDDWAKSFRGGAYDICEGGWTGAAWDPGFLLCAYLDPVNYAYSAAWDTSMEMATYSVKGVKLETKVVDGESVEVITATNNADDVYTAEHSLMDWWDILNTELQAGVLNDEFRLSLIADLEAAVLKKYYSVPVTYSFGSSLISFQADYITYDYNTFMGYGGIQYMTYNYDDLEWSEYVKKNAENGELNYK